MSQCITSTQYKKTSRKLINLSYLLKTMTTLFQISFFSFKAFFFQFSVFIIHAFFRVLFLPLKHLCLHVTLHFYSSSHINKTVREQLQFITICLLHKCTKITVKNFLVYTDLIIKWKNTAVFFATCSVPNI